VNVPAAPGPQLLARIDVTIGWEGRRAILTVAGELDWATASVLTERLDEVVAGKPEQVTLDLANLTFMDCSGVSPIVRARRVLPASCPIVLRSPIPSVRRFLAAGGIDRIDGLPIVRAASADSTRPQER
jgi:anti-anti-sigma factor